MLMSPMPRTQRSMSSATVTDQLPDGISLKVENHSRCFVIRSVASESANHAYLSKLTLRARDRRLTTMKAYVSFFDFDEALLEPELTCSVVTAHTSLRSPRESL